MMGGWHDAAMTATSVHTLDRVPQEHLPMALADRHRALPVGAAVKFRFAADVPHERRAALLAGAGFHPGTIGSNVGRSGAPEMRRARTLADIVGPGMRVLLVGLNPSLYAADAGIGFARPGNRFWPAALQAGLVSVDRDTLHSLGHHRVGFTDLVKRATARAEELGASEYRVGSERVRSLVEWLHPSVVTFVGVTGYRLAVDRGATVGWQPESFGGVSTYVMPNPSGVNAHTNVEDLVAHLQAAAARADAIVARQAR